MHTNLAHIAQVVERVLGKDEVSGSTPDMGSKIFLVVHFCARHPTNA